MNADWTEREKEVIRLNYPRVGSRGCARLLPGRTRRAIQTRARMLGVRCPRRGRELAALTLEPIDPDQLLASRSA